MKKSIFPLAVFLVLDLVEPAMANAAMGHPVAVLSLALILAVMVLLTILGGGNAVLSRIEKSRLRNRIESVLKTLRVGVVLGVVIALVLSLVSVAFTFLFGLVFGVIALVRGFRMIKWGWLARNGGERPGYLEGAEPRRLVPAGGVLVLTTVLLVSVVVVIAEHGFLLESAVYRFKEEALPWVVITEIAKTRLTEEERGRIPREEGEGSIIVDSVADAVTRADLKALRIIIEHGEDGRSFTLYMLPHLPPFPYNYLTSAPSYRADETGKIRMAYVRKKDTLCPPDAPVVMEVEEEDVQEALAVIKGYAGIE